MTCKITHNTLPETVVTDEDDTANVVEWRNGEGFDFETKCTHLGSRCTGSMSWAEFDLLKRAVNAHAKKNP